MKKLFIVAALVAANIAPAHAISEAYRRQLEREGKTQVQQIQEATPSQAFRVYHGGTNDIYEAQVTPHCVVTKVNGFPVQQLGHVGGKHRYKAGTGDEYRSYVGEYGCEVSVMERGKEVRLYAR